MNITHVRLDLESHPTLRAYCTVTIDDEFVVKQVKLIEKAGKLIVAMPAKKRTTPCVRCHCPVPITGEYCNGCGEGQGPQEPRIKSMREHLGALSEDRLSFYADLCHPITAECRAKIEEAVLEAYHAAKKDRRNDAGSDVASHDARAALERLVDGGAGARPPDDAAG